MPELPEVEMIVRDLRSKIVGRRILGVQTDWPKYFRLPSSEAGFRACITGKVITAVDRRSKNVLISLTGDYLLLIHQKISGRLLVGNWERKSESQAGSTPHSRWQAVSPPRGSTVPQGRFIHQVKRQPLRLERKHPRYTTWKNPRYQPLPHDTSWL